MRRKERGCNLRFGKTHQLVHSFRKYLLRSHYVPALILVTKDPWVRKIFWRRAWQPTPVFLPGKSHGQRSLTGCSPWGHKESDTTKQLKLFKDSERTDTISALKLFTVLQKKHRK